MILCPGVRSSDVIALDPFTPFAFLLPLHHLCVLPHQLPLSPLPLPLPGSVGLVTPPATLWLNLVVVHIFLAHRLLISIFAMHASWVAMFAFLSSLLRMRHVPLILFTLIYGLLLSLVFWATPGLSLVPSLTHFPPSSTSLPRVYSVRPHH
jgi:hypothetical protein